MPDPTNPRARTPRSRSGDAGSPLFDQLSALTTEARHPDTYDLDSMEPLAILRRINIEDAKVAEAVRSELGEIARAVELVTDRLGRGGRLVYVGAGTSGRLGVLDAAECPPTFGSAPETVIGVIAGGERALVRAVEGAEDDGAAGEAAMDALAVGSDDVVTGLAASWRTPYTVAAVARGRARGAATVYVTTNPRSRVTLEADVVIAPVVGPEVLMGSTRMKSATAQKMVLNMITTASMVRLGKVYENMMVDLMATSRKLEERSRRVLMLATGLSYAEARERLGAACGSVKRAIVMTLADVGSDDADAALAAANGFTRGALERLGGRST